MSYQKNELLEKVKSLTDDIVSMACAYEEDMALFRKALSFQPGEVARSATGDTCPCCHGRKIRVVRVFLDEYQGPAIEVQFLDEMDPEKIECDGGSNCVFAADHVRKLDEKP